MTKRSKITKISNWLSLSMTQINLSKHRFLCGRPKNLMRIFECWHELQIPPPKARWQCFTKFYHSRKEFQPYNQFGLDWLMLIGSLWSRLLMSKHLLNFLHLSIGTTASPLSAVSTLKDVQLVRCRERGPPPTGEPQLLRHIKRNVLRRLKSHWTPLSDPRNLFPTPGSIC